MNMYPEHEKLRLINSKSQAIGEFVDWLRGEKCIILANRMDCTRDEHVDGYECDGDCRPSRSLHPVDTSIEKLLAEFFGIDLDVLKLEKLEILASMSAMDDG